MAQLLSSNISGTLTVSQNTTVSGNLVVAGYNILNEIFQADNLSRVSANSGSTQSAVALNFVNTSTVQVSVTSGGSGVANVAFTSTSGGTGTVTQVNTGTGLSGGGFTTSGTISANVANTTVQGITKLIDAVNSTDSANAATGAAVKTAYDQATLGYTQANAAFTQANTANTTAVAAYGQANAAFAQANTANSVAIAAYGQANAAFTQANSAFTQANTANSIAISAYGQANAAFTAANNAANTVRVTANSGSTQSAVSLNFINTSSIQVSVGAGSAGNANVAFNAVSGSTTTAGILQLNDTVGSTSTTTAATPNIVQLARTVAIDAFSAANSAANTTLVSANSGSTLSKVSLNFNNTATIQVSVGSGSGSNANISFNYIGSTTGGGGGINTFPVSANSGSTVTANGLNFVNSSTTTISVSADSSGNANVSITSKAIQTDYYSSIYSNKQMMEWVHNRDGKIFNIGSNTPVGVFANTSGTRFYVADSASDTVNQLNLSEAWNIASATTETANLSIAAQDATPADLFLKSDGTVLYILGDTDNNIISYPLSEAWNVRSAGAATESTTLGTATWRALFFKEDGSKMYVGNTSGILQFSLGTNWDVSTRTLETSLTTSGIDSSLEALSISPDGNLLYIVGATNDRMYELKMSTAFNVATAVYNNFYSRVKDTQTQYSGESTPAGIFVAYPNNKMYIVGNSSDSVIQYEIDEGVTVEAKKLFANGKAHFMDDVFVVGDLIATEALVSEGSMAVGTSGQFTISTAGAVTAPSITVSGTTTLSGSIITSGNSSIDLGVGTGNTTTNLAIGATNAGNTKSVRIGTGGTAGSLTNMLIGPSGANATINVFANTTTFSNSVDIANQLIVSGLNIINELALADNTVRVSANSGATLSNKYLNFVNTATVTVSVTDAGDGNANIAFTSSGSSGVNSVDTGLGLTGGPITSTGTLSANIASTTVQGITKLIDSVTSTDAANAATASSVKTAYDQATNAYGKANTAHETAVAAYGQANVSTNRTQVSANSGSIQTNVAINFINTDSILVSVAPGTAGNANVAFSSNTTALRTIWIPAQAMISRTTSGAGTSTTEGATNRVMAKTFDFDTTTQEYAQFSIRMPKSWNLGTISFSPYWTATGTTAGTVSWTLAGVALSDNEAIDTAFGTAQASTDTWQTANCVHIGPEPATPITIGNVPVAGDIVFFQISRDVANDTLDRDAKLLGVTLFVTVNARDDR